MVSRRIPYCSDSYDFLKEVPLFVLPLTVGIPKGSAWNKNDFCCSATFSPSMTSNGSSSSSPYFSHEPSLKKVPCYPMFVYKMDNNCSRGCRTHQRTCHYLCWPLSFMYWRDCCCLGGLCSLEAFSFKTFPQKTIQYTPIPKSILISLQ